MLLSDKQLVSLEEAASRLKISEEAIVHKGIAEELSCCIFVHENVTKFMSSLSSMSGVYEELIYSEEDKYFIEQFYKLSRQELKAMLYRQEGCVGINEFSVDSFFANPLPNELGDKMALRHSEWVMV